MNLRQMARLTGLIVRERRAHELKQSPIVPAVDGTPPGWVVTCLEDRCGYMTDARGLDAEDAVKTVAAVHQRGHKLTALASDLSNHPLYK